MISIKLAEDFEEKLVQIAKNQSVTADEMIRKILHQYVDNYFQSPSPYELGKDLFGKYGSGREDVSKNYKAILKEKLRAKHSH